MQYGHRTSFGAVKATSCSRKLCLHLHINARSSDVLVYPLDGLLGSNFVCLELLLLTKLLFKVLASLQARCY